MTRRIHVNPWRTDTKTRKFTQNSDSDQTYTLDLSSVASDRSTTVSSVTWSSFDDVDLTNQSLASGVSTVTISAPWRGKAVIKASVVYADSSTETHYINLEFYDPEYRR